MARMIVIYKEPRDPQAFDRHYFEVHIPLAKRLPGLLRYEVSRGPIVTMLGAPGTYLIGTLHFADMDAMKRAFASPEGQACAADRELYAPDDSGVEMYLVAHDEVVHGP